MYKFFCINAYILTYSEVFLVLGVEGITVGCLKQSLEDVLKHLKVINIVLNRMLFKKKTL